MFPRVFFSVLVLMLSACSKPPVFDSSEPVSGNSGGGASSSASSGSRPSMTHRAGEDCIACHRTGGSGEAHGVFTVAGTIHKNALDGQPNATVTLYVPGTNTVLVTLQTDGSGNFYSYDNVSGLSTSGANVHVSVTSGMSKDMPLVTISGSCNGCHGATVKDLIIN